MTFPIVPAGQVPPCFMCGGQTGKREDAGYWRGGGEFRAYCPRCDVFTWFDDQAGPDEAATILAAMAVELDKPAPLESCPFSLSAPKVSSTPAVQPGLFEGE